MSDNTGPSSLGDDNAEQSDDQPEVPDPSLATEPDDLWEVPDEINDSPTTSGDEQGADPQHEPAPDQHYEDEQYQPGQQYNDGAGPYGAHQGAPGPGAYTHPPQPGQPARLLRDPTGTVGGVLSGISNYFGVDVSLIKLVFILFCVFTAGTALVAYVIAWIVIPEAQSWPPHGSAAQPPNAGISSRHLAIGLIVLGAILVLGIGNVAGGELVLALAMVGGGIWLLGRSPSDNQVPPTAPTGYPQANGPHGASGPVGSGPSWAPSQSEDNLYGGGAPLEKPKRSRASRFFRGLLISTVVLLFVVIPLILILAIAAFFVSGGRADGVDVSVTPTGVADFPLELHESNGTLHIDLTDIDLETIDDQLLPLEIDASLDFGEIVVDVPEGASVDADLSAGFGEVSLFDSHVGGISPDIRESVEDADFEVTLDVTGGSVRVTKDG